MNPEELFERLSLGHRARITVVTPNRRLSQFLQRQFDRRQLAGGLERWETADILPFNAFVQRMWEDALYAEGAADPALLLSGAQEQALWEDTIHHSKRAEALLSAAAAAEECREAWELAHAWRLLPALTSAAFASTLNEDARAFIEWSARYARITAERGLTDAARLPDVVLPLLAHEAVRKPATLVLFGFDRVTLQQKGLLDALKSRGVQILALTPDPSPEGRGEPERGYGSGRAPQQRGQARRREFASVKEELTAAARWARARLEAGDDKVRIGIVVPELTQVRSLVQRTLASVLQPDSLLPANENPALPFDLSLGLPLTQYPLINDGLLMLQLIGRELAFSDISRLLRSPFLAGAQSEMAVRARLDAAIRERCGATLDLEQLLRRCAAKNAPAAPILTERLAQLAQRRKVELVGNRHAPEWARAFSEILHGLGFPGERTLDSAQHQTLQKWHELLAAFATLERVTGKMSHTQAWQRLRRMAADTLFQPEGPDAPIQVLGVFESAGLIFDHLWVVGLTDDAWPLSPRPNPFLPIRLQREAAIPQSSAALSLERDRQMTHGWLAAAPEVIVSHARMKEDSEFAPSPLIAGVQIETRSADMHAVDALEQLTLREVIHRAYRIETLDDGNGPALSPAIHEGGTAIFKDQAACPFRAFARYRLHSEAPETPQPGLDAADRGTLLHHMLAVAWTALGNKANLVALDDVQLTELLERCADDALARLRHFKPEAMEPRFEQIERARLIRRAREWLLIERSRKDFTVVAVERKQPVTFGGLTVNAKLDRMDRLGAVAPRGGEAAADHVIIDYKTGTCAVSAWLGQRPDEPQLPMYALSAAENISAVAFAQLKAGDLRFKGVARTEELLPGVNLIAKDRSRLAKSYADWEALVKAWRLELEELGWGFASGDARVDPKQGLVTCRQCDQQLFCRIAERVPVAPGENGDE